MVRASSSGDGSGQRLHEELLYSLLCPKSSVYFETATEFLLLSRQRCCRVSTKHCPLLCLSGHPSLHLPACLWGGRRATSFCKIIALKPYLSRFWTSLKLYTSSSHMPLLPSELRLPFLVCEPNPRAQCTTRAVPAAQDEPVFWAETSHSPSVHEKDHSEGEGQWNYMLRGYFFLMFPTYTRTHTHDRPFHKSNFSPLHFEN